MVDNDAQTLRESFAHRLSGLMDDAQWKERGRAPRLRREIVERGGRISIQGVHKWLDAQSMPDRPNMLRLSEIFNVSVESLEHGQANTLDDHKLAALRSIRGKATPRTVAALDRIENAAKEGRLTEEDILLLEGIAQRFEKLRSDQS